MSKYSPPVQSKLGQVIDVVVLLALSIGALFVPLWMGLAGSSKVPQQVENPTWESLGQNPAMVEKWNQLGFADAASAADTITARFDYSFSIVSLAIMVVVILGYYIMLIRFSDAEYRDVINEKFGSK